MPSGAWEGSARRKEKKRTFTGKISHVCVLYKKTKAMKILKTILCAALLVAGLCGCEKQLIPEEVGRRCIRKECRMQGW